MLLLQKSFIFLTTLNRELLKRQTLVGCFSFGRGHSEAIASVIIKNNFPVPAGEKHKQYRTKNPTLRFRLLSIAEERLPYCFHISAPQSFDGIKLNGYDTLTKAGVSSFLLRSRVSHANKLIMMPKFCFSLWI